MTATQRVVMVATSYPRFSGDTVGTFMEPIARGLASRGHEVHLVLPWHPRWQRGTRDGEVSRRGGVACDLDAGTPDRRDDRARALGRARRGDRGGGLRRQAARHQLARL
jgi:hypothetical protein